MSIWIYHKTKDNFTWPWADEHVLGIAIDLRRSTALWRRSLPYLFKCITYSGTYIVWFIHITDTILVQYPINFSTSLISHIHWQALDRLNELRSFSSFVILSSIVVSFRSYLILASDSCVLWYIMLIYITASAWIVLAVVTSGTWSKLVCNHVQMVHTPSMLIPLQDICVAGKGVTNTTDY